MGTSQVKAVGLNIEPSGTSCESLVVLSRMSFTFTERTTDSSVWMINEQI